MIPRPQAAEPGGPPPWAPRRGITVGTVLAALARAGRGLEHVPHDDLPGRSAVLVALFEEDGEARVVLTRRAASLRTHRGQVSFPGGRIDPGEDAVSAALREAREEVGLDPGLVRPVGCLRPASAFSTGVPITPVVGVLARRPLLVPSPAEVDRVFDVSLADLASACRQEWWTEPGRPRFAMYVFSVDGETVWGATARMLVDLLGTILGDGADAPVGGSG